MQKKTSSSEKIFNLDNQAKKLGMGGKLSPDNDENSYKPRMQQRKDIQAERLQIRKIKKGLLIVFTGNGKGKTCLLYTSPSPRDQEASRMPSSA